MPTSPLAGPPESSAASPTRPKRYRDFKSYLKERFGRPVFKVPLDAGFTCPNRDGTVGRGGCSYCDGRGSRLRQAGPLPPISEQLRRGIDFYRRVRKADFFIPYFQTFTNTHAPSGRLAALFDEALGLPGVVGLAVGTRPDCLPEETVGLLASRAEGRDVWVEIGLQSIHQRTLDRLNRCHGVPDFTDAVKRCSRAGLLVCAHVILGLPGEDGGDMAATARALASLPLAAVKIHLLMVLEGTPLAREFRRGEFAVPSLEEYAGLAADFLELLPPEMVVQRLTADGKNDVLLAPGWARNKLAVLEAVHRELERRDTRQGARWSAAAGGDCRKAPSLV